MTALGPGTLLDGRWALERLLGRGAMGEVWAAIDRRTGAAVAVKAPRAAERCDDEQTAHFAREARVLSKVRSPYVCGLVALGDAEGMPFLVLERLEGETLTRTLTREGALQVTDALTIGEHILEALVVAHRAGVLHRDLNPNNVFLAARNEEDVVARVLDFGVAREHDRAPSVSDELTVGTLAYVAPEQMGGAGTVDARCDLYAVGSILVHALTGVPPFGALRGARLIATKCEREPPSLDALTGDCWPAALSGFVARTTAREPRRRFPSAEVALASLRAVRKKLAGEAAANLLERTGRGGPARDTTRDTSSDTTPPTETLEKGADRKRRARS